MSSKSNNYIILLFFYFSLWSNTPFHSFFETLQQKTAHLSFLQGCAVGGSLSLLLVLGVYYLKSNNLNDNSADTNHSRPSCVHLKRPFNYSFNALYPLSIRLYEDPEALAKAELYEDLKHLCLAGDYEFFPRYYKSYTMHQVIPHTIAEVSITYQAPLDPLFVLLYTNCNLPIDRNTQIEWELWKNIIIKYTAFKTPWHSIDGSAWKALLLFGFKNAQSKKNKKRYIQRRLWLLYACMLTPMRPHTIQQLKEIWHAGNYENMLADCS